MKKYIIIASILGLISLPKTNAQIKTSAPTETNIVNQNPFIDASSQSAYPSAGKGIVFPRTNLTTFKFKTDLFDGLGLVFPTAFDGMLVYNTHVEPNATIEDPATGTYTLDLKEGFYYFSNPGGNESGSLTGGRWKPLGVGAASLANFYSQNGTLSEDREVNLNNHNLNFTGGKVGINTTEPKASLEIVKKDIDFSNPTGQAQGVIFPKFSTEERLTFQNIVEGTIIYNTTKKCLEMYRGAINGAHQWQCLPDAGSAQSQNITVLPAGFEGQYIGGVELTNANKVKFKLQNNGFSAISNVDFSNALNIQNGADNNVQVLPNQNNDISLASGAETTLTYRLTGTPETGSLTATFDRLGLQADQSIQVGLGSATISNKNHYLVSMVHNSTTIQGKINNGNEKITLEIPYTNGQGSYNEVNIIQTTAIGQGGDTNELTLNIPPNTFNSAGNLTASIEVGGDGEYLLKQMAPGASYDIATFDIDMNGSTFQIVLKGIGGVLDKKYGNEAYDFIYLPVQITASNGYNKTWLNMNLGAEAAKVSSPNFNPTLVKTGEEAHNDPTLHGSLYQWQRPTDGHEFRTSPSTSVLATNWQATAPAAVAGKYVISDSEHKYMWIYTGINYYGSDLQLWQAGSINNPCPTGYHVPTRNEWLELKQAMLANDAVGNLANQTLIPNLAKAGYRSVNSSASPVYSWLRAVGNEGIYWTSNWSKRSYAYKLWIKDSNIEINPYTIMMLGASVRCIKD